MLGGSATGASAAEPEARGLTAQRLQGKYFDCASFVHILKKRRHYEQGRI